MADRAAQQRVLAQVDPADRFGLASTLIRIPSFKTEETPVARFLAPFFRERDYRVELQEVEAGRLQAIATLPGTGGGAREGTLGRPLTPSGRPRRRICPPARRRAPSASRVR